MTKISSANSSKLASTLRSIMVLSGGMLISGCGTYSEPPPVREHSYQERPAKPAQIPESCMTEAQCEQSKKEYMDFCKKESASTIESCQAKFKKSCKTADNIVPPNDRDALDKCCGMQGAKERVRCDKEMANEYECDRIEKIAVNACIGKSPASKASSYTESAPKPLQPSAQPNGGPAPSAAPQSSEY